MNFSNINMLSDAYAAMRSLGLVDTKAAFSRRILGKGPSYLTSTVAKGREPSDAIIGRLLEQLIEWERNYSANVHCGADYAPGLTASYRRLVALRQVVEAHLSAREAFATPKNVIAFRRAA